MECLIFPSLWRRVQHGQVSTLWTVCTMGAQRSSFCPMSTMLFLTGGMKPMHIVYVCMCVSTVKLYMNVYMWSIFYRHSWFMCMYVPMHGCTYVCYIYIYVCTYSYVFVNACICACMQVSICVHIGVCKYYKIVNKCIYVGYNLWTHMYLSVCIFQWMDACEFVIFIMHIYIQLGICVHVCVHKENIIFHSVILPVFCVQVCVCVCMYTKGISGCTL